MDEEITELKTHFEEIMGIPSMYGAKITLVVRSPTFPDGRDIVLTNDNPPDAASALLRHDMKPGFLT